MPESGDLFSYEKYRFFSISTSPMLFIRILTSCSFCLFFRLSAKLQGRFSKRSLKKTKKSLDQLLFNEEAQ